MSSPRTLVVPGYQVMQYLGSGARSTIWQIRDCQTGEFYALKRVVKQQRSDVRHLAQALNEHNIGTKLDHPVVRHIYRMRRIIRWLGLREIHLIMEYCEGLTVQEERPRDIRETVRIFEQVSAGVAHMNARGFVHADTKPNNILVVPGKSVKIIDLGQSCAIGTVKERIQGTPDFIAPEQVHRQPLDSRTDVFNFGATLYWALTGQPIPTVLPRQGAVTLKDDVTFTPPEQLNPDVSPALTKLVVDCIDLRPQRRPDSMQEVHSRLALISHTMDRTANLANNNNNQDA